MAVRISEIELLKLQWTWTLLPFKLPIFLQHHKHNILLSALLTEIFASFSQLKMLYQKTDCNNIIL